MNEQATQRPAPGWYPDPSGEAELRYWDGGQWTDDTRSADGATDAAAGAAPEAAPATSFTETSVIPEAPAAPAAGAQPWAQAPAAPASPYAQQAPQFGAGPALHAHSNEAGFFKSLFDFSFAAERSVTTRFARILYIIGIVVSLFMWIGTTITLFIAGAITNAAGSYLYDGDAGAPLMVFGVLTLIFGWIPGFINIILLRVGLEFVVFQIRTSQHTAELVRLERAKQAQA